MVRMHQRQNVSGLHVVNVEQIRFRIRVWDFIHPRRQRVPIRCVRWRLVDRRGDAVIVRPTMRHQ